MTFVIDANVAAKWFFEQPGYEEARSYGGGSKTLIAPELIAAELASAFIKYIRANELTLDAARSMVVKGLRAFSILVPLHDLAGDAMRLSHALSHSVYDCFYIALAERERATLVTADRKLAAAAEKLDTVSVTLLSNF